MKLICSIKCEMYNVNETDMHKFYSRGKLYICDKWKSTPMLVCVGVWQNKC